MFRCNSNRPTVSARGVVIACVLLLLVAETYRWVAEPIPTTSEKETIPVPCDLTDCQKNLNSLVNEKIRTAGSSSSSSSSSADFHIISLKDPMIRFSVRNVVAQRGCENFEAVARVKPKALTNNVGSMFANKTLRWCEVYKSGSSNTRFTNETISKSTKQTQPTMKQMRNPKSFVVVRDPFSRLVSGYIDKFMINRFDIYFPMVQSILKLFRPNVTENEMSCAFGMSFYELVKYLIHSQETGWLRHNHFVPITEICDPCQKPFDFIVHLETYYDDMRAILESVDMDHVLPSKSKKMKKMKKRSADSKLFMNTTKLIGSVNTDEAINSRKKQHAKDVNLVNTDNVLNTRKKLYSNNNEANRTNTNEVINTTNKLHVKGANPVMFNTVDELKTKKKPGKGIGLRDIIKQRLQNHFDLTLNNVTACLSKHGYLKQIWWAFQVRGTIWDEIPFHWKEEESENKSLDDIIQLFYEAQVNSVGKFDVEKQRRRHLVDLYLQIPLKERVKVMDIFAKDCLVFGYDTQPSDLFPELSRQIIM